MDILRLLRYRHPRCARRVVMRSCRCVCLGRVISEEIFEHASEDMTSEKTKAMKKNLNREFTLIYQLCDYIFANSQNPTLLNVTLQTLQRFLNWIPVGYIFETNLIETLAVKVRSDHSYHVVRCCARLTCGDVSSCQCRYFKTTRYCAWPKLAV